MLGAIISAHRVDAGLQCSYELVASLVQAPGLVFKVGAIVGLELLIGDAKQGSKAGICTDVVELIEPNHRNF